jgi:AraC family transcriptional regulator
LAQVAKQVRLSVSHFCRGFKESFGASPHEYLMRLRVEKAQSLMLTTDERLSHIAAASGFTDQAHLTKLFRRFVGETPNSWRRKNLADFHVEPFRLFEHDEKAHTWLKDSARTMTNYEQSVQSQDMRAR